MVSNATDIILRPIITEKSTDLVSNKKYTFQVAKHANKTNIKLAIEQIFKVEVEKVSIINQKPRPRRVGRHSGYKKAYKKAIIKLTPASDEITVFVN